MSCRLVSRCRQTDIATRLKHVRASASQHNRIFHSSRVLSSTIAITDHQTEDDEKLERVFKIPTIRGMNILRNPQLSKGTAFSIAERQILGIQGLLPPTVCSQMVQTERAISGIRGMQTDLQKYIALNQLLSRSEKLFYQLMMEHTEELLPIAYNPTVGKACQEFGHIFDDPHGLFITIHDIGHVYDIITNWPERRVQAVVVTTGEDVGGLGTADVGDLGCNGMGVPIGKCQLYTACGGIHPSACLPLMIDVGTNNEKLLADPMYIGIREKRHSGEKVDQLLYEVIDALHRRFGSNVLIQFEDMSERNTNRLLSKMHDICSFNDDIQGTSGVVLGGLLGAQRITGTSLKDQTFMFLGADSTTCGVAKLIVRELKQRHGLSAKEAEQKIFMVDEDGLLTRSRPFGDIAVGQSKFLHDVAPIDNLFQAVTDLKPTCLIGVAGSGLFTEQVCRQMAVNCERPIIFALSHPQSECTAEDAYTWTDSACVYAGACASSSVTVGSTTFTPSEANNVYIFPGVALGQIASSAQNVPEDMFLAAAETLANQLTEDDIKEGRVFPPLTKIRETSLQIAVSVARVAYDHGIARVMPEPNSIEDLVRRAVYTPDYLSNIPMTFSYPEDHAELH